MRAVMRRVSFVLTAAVGTILLAGVLQAVPGAASAATGPVVTGVSPPSGPEAGGTTVTITGTGFTGATAVDFGSMAASSFTVAGDTSVTAVAPATTVAGPADVTVTTPAGTSAAGAADQFYYADQYTASSGADVASWGPTVTAVDQNSSQIDIPYYIKPAGDYELSSVDDGSGLYRLIDSQINLSGGTPKDEWPLWAGFIGPISTFIGVDTCGSETWPLHTMSYPNDPNCWEIAIDASQQGGLTTGLWDVWVPTAITNASGQTLVFAGWSGDASIQSDAQTGQCDTGDIGYVENWPGAGNGTPGVPGAFTGGEEFNLWGGGSLQAKYALQSARTTAPLIEIGAQQYGRPSEFDCQWYQQNAVVAPQFSCVDQDGSGVASCAATAGVTADGDLDTATPGGHTLTITATDNDGNKRTLSLNYFVGQPPAVTIAADPAAPSATGWYNVSQLGAGNSLPVTVTISPSPADDSIDTASCTLDGDTQNPVLSFSSTPNNPDTIADNVPATFTRPGPVTLQIPQGIHALSCTAADLSGAATTQSASYQVGTSSPPQAQFLLPPQVTGTSSTKFTCDGVSSYDGAVPDHYQEGQSVSIEWSLDVADAPDISGIVSPATTSTTNGFATGYTTLDTSLPGAHETPAPDTVDGAGNVTPGQECPYYVDGPPVVTGVSPASGPLAGGTTVTITGAGFTGATTVGFGSVAASSFTVNSDTSITATAPAASAGPVDVTVTTPAGTSHAVAADRYSYVYSFTGFEAPVANPPVVNVVHAGQAIPIQFQLGGDFGLNILASGYPSAQQVSCDSGAPVNTGTATDTSGASGLQYDAATGTYTYVWKTSKASTGTCQLFTLELNDGTTHTALFQYAS